VTGSAGFGQLFGANVLRAPFSEARPFPQRESPTDTVTFVSVRQEPGARMSAAVLPRYRLTREMTFAAGYRFDHQGATTWGGDVLLGPVERADAWTAHSLSLGASYSTIEAFEAGRSRVPVEVSLLYHNSFAGSGYAPHAGTLEVVGRLLYQAVGRPRRARAADSTAVDSARTLPAPPSAQDTVSRPRPRPAPPAAEPRTTPAGEPTTNPNPAVPPPSAPIPRNVPANPSIPVPTSGQPPPAPATRPVTPPSAAPPPTPPPAPVRTSPK
jgi:hypothetical protein